MRKIMRILASLGLVLAVIVPTGAAAVLAGGLSSGTTGVITAAKPLPRPQPLQPPGFDNGQQPSNVEQPTTGKANRSHSF